MYLNNKNIIIQRIIIHLMLKQSLKRQINHDNNILKHFTTYENAWQRIHLKSANRYKLLPISKGHLLTLYI